MSLLATCVPPCQNLGFCKAPGECICPDIFEGPKCQFTKTQRCVQKPYTPSNSRVICNDKECISTCNKGFTFPDGSKELKMVCDDGNWVQRNQPTGTLQKVPDCQRNHMIDLFAIHRVQLTLVLSSFLVVTAHSRMRPSLR